RLSAPPLSTGAAGTACASAGWASSNPPPSSAKPIRSVLTRTERIAFRDLLDPPARDGQQDFLPLELHHRQLAERPHRQCLKQFERPAVLTRHHAGLIFAPQPQR